MTRHLRAAVLGLVLPALLTGCAAAGFAPGTSDEAAAGPPGPSWIVTTQGSATPSPSPSFGTSPAPAATGGFLPLGAVAPTRTPVGPCAPNSFHFSRIAGVDVVPGSTTAVLSWYNVGGDNLREFRLYAISQDLALGRQRDVGFVTVPPKKPCGQMSATLTNLSPGTAYVFSVDAVVTRHSGDGSRAATVARSQPVTTKG